jgi:hypothetical protein
MAESFQMKSTPGAMLSVSIMRVQHVLAGYFLLSLKRAGFMVIMPGFKHMSALHAAKQQHESPTAYESV